MTIVYILLAVIAVIALVSFGAFLVACLGIRKQITPPANSIFIREKERFDKGREWFFGMKPEEITVTSYDGLPLHGLFLRNGESKKTVLLMHGYRGSINDFAPALPRYFELGLNMLVVDQRAHGKSGGRYICYGAKERFDCKMWADYIAETLVPGGQIILDGISMGASTVLMASDLPFAGDVRGIVADCGYSNVRDEFEHVCRNMMHLPRFPLLYLTLMWVKLIAGFDPKATDAAASLRKTAFPVLFIHGENDNFVPPESSRRNFESCASKKRLEMFPGAAHGESFLEDEERCVALLKAFFSEVLD